MFGHWQCFVKSLNSKVFKNSFNTLPGFFWHAFPISMCLQPSFLFIQLFYIYWKPTSWKQNKLCKTDTEKVELFEHSNQITILENSVFVFEITEQR